MTGTKLNGFIFAVFSLINGYESKKAKSFERNTRLFETKVDRDGGRATFYCKRDKLIPISGFVAISLILGNCLQTCYFSWAVGSECFELTLG